MIDKKISIGSILTILTAATTVVYMHGANITKIENIEEEQVKTVKRINKNEEEIVNLKVGVAKLESQLDNRFDRLEEILMDISD
jgi:septal ring factor EnvC (AmiA/AmiB activator)